MKYNILDAHYIRNDGKNELIYFVSKLDIVPFDFFIERREFHAQVCGRLPLISIKT